MRRWGGATSAGWLFATTGLLTAGCSSTTAPTPSGTLGEEVIESRVTDEPVVEETAESAVLSSPVAAYLEDEVALVRGRGVFRAACTGYCHTSRSAKRVAPDLFDCVWTHGETDADIYQVMYDGVPDTQMLGFGEKVPDEDLWKVIAYLRKQSQCG